MTRVLLLTGEIGCGKSTVASWVVALARSRGLRCDGLLTLPRVQPSGEKSGIDGVRLGTGERRRMAARDVPEPCDRVGIWRFYPGALDWALQSALGAMASDADLVVVDEIGPLELYEGGGLAPVIPELNAVRVPLALVIVREALVDDLAARLDRCEVQVYRVTLENRSELPEQIVAEQFGPGQ